MSQAIEGLYEIADAISRRGVLWTQGAGGNVSVKSDGKLWVKASGLRLDQMRISQGVVSLDLQKVMVGFHSLSEKDESGYSSLLKTLSHPLVASSQYRASMETGFHAGLNKKYVTHFHSLVSVIMGFEMHKDFNRWQSWWKQQAEPLLGPAVLIDFVMPGLELAKAIVKKDSASLFFIRNHGLVWQSDEAPQLDLYANIEEKFCRDFGYSLPDLNHLPDQQIARWVYPDFAVYAKEILDHMDPNSLTVWKLVKSFSNPNLEELWKAHVILLQMNSDLPELPISISQEISKLPTEVFRRLLQGAH